MEFNQEGDSAGPPLFCMHFYEIPFLHKYKNSQCGAIPLKSSMKKLKLPLASEQLEEICPIVTSFRKQFV